MDNRKFCKTVKPLFSDKSKSRKTITFIENKKIEVNNSKIADVLHNYLVTSQILQSLWKSQILKTLTIFWSVHHKQILRLFWKKLLRTRKRIIEQLVNYWYFLKYLKIFWRSNFYHTLKTSFQNLNVALVLSIVDIKMEERLMITMKLLLLC